MAFRCGRREATKLVSCLRSAGPRTAGGQTGLTASALPDGPFTSTSMVIPGASRGEALVCACPLINATVSLLAVVSQIHSAAAGFAHFGALTPTTSGLPPTVQAAKTPTPDIE